MQTYLKGPPIPYAPTDTELYPETDGKPMAASDMHREILIRTLQVFEAHFEQYPDVYISGDIMMYDIEGPLRTAISPDVLIAFGLGRKQRRTYKVWEEGKPPDFVMEFSSASTYQNDLTGKMDHYAKMGIQDYFLYDAERQYLPAPLIGFTLVNGVYVEILPGADGGLHSEVLGLDFHLRDPHFGIYDPVSEQWLQTRSETAEARAETAEARAETAETRAETAETQAKQEAASRQKAEAEATQLREQLARLQADTE